MTFTCLQAQDLSGLRASNYGGLYRATYNPSVLGGSPYKWQFNLATINSSINNRYFLYLGRNSVLYPALASKSSKELYGRSRTMGSITNPDRIHLVSDVRWPSLMLTVAKHHGVALQFRSRGFVQGEGIPAEMKMLYTKRLDTPKEGPGGGEWGDFYLKQHSFSEMAASYGVQLVNRKEHKVKTGLTVKQLWGGRTSFIKGHVENYSYGPVGGGENEVTLNNFRYEAGFTRPVGSATFPELLKAGNYGQGWAVDIGFTYEIGSHWYRSDPGDQRPGYVLRLAGSVNDMGQLRYRTRSSERFSGEADQWVMGQREMETIADYGPEGMRMLLEGASDGDFTGKGRLPGMYHWEADVQLVKSFFINIAGSRSLYKERGNLLDIRQPGHFTITPRWEYEDADYAFPIAFIEGKKQVAVGVSGRVGPVQAGVSNFLGLIGKGDTRATYAYLGVSLFHVRTRDHRKKIKWKPAWD